MKPHQAAWARHTITAGCLLLGSSLLEAAEHGEAPGWTPLTVDSLFEDWGQPWAGPPAGSSGAPRHG